MRDNSTLGCFGVILLFVIVLLPFKLTLDYLENNELCYKYIPFCESSEEKAIREFEETKEHIYLDIKFMAKNSSPKKWHEITTYKANNSGYVYYLGTNSLNGIYLYWSGETRDYDIWALDYQANEKLRVPIYDGQNRIELMDEFLVSEEALPLHEETEKLINF